MLKKLILFILVLITLRTQAFNSDSTKKIQLGIEISTSSINNEMVNVPGSWSNSVVNEDYNTYNRPFQFGTFVQFPLHSYLGEFRVFYANHNKKNTSNFEQISSSYHNVNNRSIEVKYHTMGIALGFKKVFQIKQLKISSGFEIPLIYYSKSQFSTSISTFDKNKTQNQTTYYNDYSNTNPNGIASGLSINLELRQALSKHYEIGIGIQSNYLAFKNTKTTTATSYNYYTISNNDGSVQKFNYQPVNWSYARGKQSETYLDFTPTIRLYYSL